MSSENNPPGSEGEVVTFEEIAELDSGELDAAAAAKTYKCRPGYEWDPTKKACVKVKKDISGPDETDLIEVAGPEPMGTIEAARYPKGAKTYKCAPGYAWDPKKKACVKVKKEIAGPEETGLMEVSEEELLAMAKKKTCPAGQEWDDKAGKCVPVKKGQKPDECPVGEVWDDKAKKCVPVKEALAARDTVITDLTARMKQMEDALRLKKIEGQVEDQIRTGHIAPVQRDKVISFMAGLPDEKLEDLTGIFSHQKFPLQKETGGQVTKPPGTEKKGIGESESAKDLSDEEKAVLMKRYGIDRLISERGVKRAA